MKKLIQLLFFASTICIGSSQEEIFDPLSLNFVKEYQVRNFFNSSVPLTRLDLSEDVTTGAEYPVFNRTSPGLELAQKGEALEFNNSSTDIQQSYLNLGKVYPYMVVDMDVVSQTHTSYTASALIGLYKDNDNQVVLTSRGQNSGNKSISLEVIKEGQSVLNKVLAAEGYQAPFTLRLHLTGHDVSVLIVKGDEWKYLGTENIKPHFDLRDKVLLASFSLMAGARLASGESVSVSRVEQYLTSGAGQANPRVLHYEDGTPMVKDNNIIWVAFSTTNYGAPTLSNSQGIFEYNIQAKTWKLVSALTFNKGDGMVRPWRGAEILFDRRDSLWKIVAVSHGDDHKMYQGTAAGDILSGYYEVPVTLMNYASVANEEDPSIFYDSTAGKWRMAVCKNPGGGYQTPLFEADAFDGEWKQIAIYTPQSSTGILIQKVGGVRYVFLGRGADPCPMEVLSYPGMEKLGELNLDVHPQGHNVWPGVIPISSDSGTVYYLLTFDRDERFGGWSYGNLHWYQAKEFAYGFQEYVPLSIPISLVPDKGKAVAENNLRIQPFRTTINVYNIKGKFITQFQPVNSELANINWNGKDGSGEKLPEGIYYLKKVGTSQARLIYR